MNWGLIGGVGAGVVGLALAGGSKGGSAPAQDTTPPVAAQPTDITLGATKQSAGFSDVTVTLKNVPSDAASVKVELLDATGQVLVTQTGLASQGAYTFAHQGDGSYSARVSYTDAAHNPSVAVSAAQAIVVDTQVTAPVIHLAAGKADGAVTDNGAITVDVTSLDVHPDKVEYRVDDSTGTGVWTTLVAANGQYVVPQAAQDGVHQVEVRQTDAYSNVSTTATLHYTLDTAASQPQIQLERSVTVNGTIVSGDGAIRLLASSLDPHPGKVQYSIDGAAWADLTAADLDPTGTGDYLLPLLALDGTQDVPHKVQVQQIDQLQHVSAISEINYTLDTVLGSPSIQFVNGQPNGAVTTDGSVKVLAGSLVDPDLATVEFSVDNGVTWQPAVKDPNSAAGDFLIPSMTQDGVHSVQVILKDQLGHVSAQPATLSYVLDTQAAVPAIQFANGQADGSVMADGTITVLGTSLDPHVVSVEYNLDSMGWVAMTPDAQGNYVVPGALTDGSHTVDVRQTDVLGHVGMAAAALSYVLDTQAAVPAIQFANGQADGSVMADGTITVLGTSLDPHVVSVEYNLDGAADSLGQRVWLTAQLATDGSGNYVVPSVAADQQHDGSHTVQVRQADAAGNVTTVPASLSYTMDSTAPAAAVLHLLNGSVLTAGATLANASFEVVLPAADLNASVRYEVYPTVSGPTGQWMSLAADTNGKYFIPSPSVSDQYTVVVTLTDSVGNTNSGTSANFTLAGVAGPSVSLIRDTGVAADGITSDPTLVVAADLTAPAAMTQFEYSLDGISGWRSSSPVTAGLVDGTYSFYVRSVDPANPLTGVSLPTHFQFTLDTAVTQPMIQLSNGVADGGITNNGTVAVLASSIDPNVSLIEYSLDGGAWATITADAQGNYVVPSPALDGTQDGVHGVQVRQFDVAGNPVAASTVLSYTLDSVLPTQVALGNPQIDTSVTANGTLTILGSSLDANVATVQYSLDGGKTWSAAAGPINGDYSVPTPTVDGVYTVRITQTDWAANVSPVLQVGFTLDTTSVPPVIQLANGVADGGVTTDGAVTIQASSIDPHVATVEYNLDGAGWVTITPDVQGNYGVPSPALDGTQDGAHTVQVRQTDLAGNQTPVPTSISYTLDSQAPTAVVLGSAPIDGSITAQGAITILGSSLDANVATVQYSLDGGKTWSAAAGPINGDYGVPAPTTDGNYTVQITQTDWAGLVSPVTQVSFALDTVATPPTLALDPATSMVINAMANSRGGLFGVTQTDAHPGNDVYSLDGNTWMDLATLQTQLSTTSTPVTGSAVNVWVQSTDLAGNVSTPVQALSFNLDNATNVPLVGLATDGGLLNDHPIVGSQAILTNQPAFLADAMEAGATLTYSTDNGVTWQNVVVNPATGTFTPNLPANLAGQHATAVEVPLTVRQTDALGNTADYVSSFAYDNFAAVPTVATSVFTPGGRTAVKVIAPVQLVLGGEAGSHFMVSEDMGTTWVDSSIYTPSKMGATILMVHQIDTAGNVSADTLYPLYVQGSQQSGARAATVDISNTFVNLPHLVLTDNGASTTDHVTSLTTFGLQTSLGGVAGDTMSYSLDGGAWTVLPVGTGLANLSVLADGVHNVQFQETMTVGRIKHYTPVLSASFTVDSTAPTAATAPVNPSTAEIVTTTSTGESVAVMRVSFNEAVSVNPASLVFDGINGVALKSQAVAASGLSLDHQVSLGVQPDGSTLVEFRFTEAVPGTFTNLIVPSAHVTATDLAGNSATVQFNLTPAGQTAAFTDWTNHVVMP